MTGGKETSSARERMKRKYKKRFLMFRGVQMSLCKFVPLLWALSPSSSIISVSLRQNRRLEKCSKRSKHSSDAPLINCITFDGCLAIDTRNTLCWSWTKFFLSLYVFPLSRSIFKRTELGSWIIWVTLLRSQGLERSLEPQAVALNDYCGLEMANGQSQNRRTAKTR